MRFREFPCLLLMLTSAQAWAKDQTLIIVGSQPKDPKGFEESSRLIYEQSRKAGREVRILATDGSFKFGAAGEMLPASSLDSVREQIQAAVERIKRDPKGGTLLIHIDDHGTSPATSPASGGFLLHNASEKDGNWVSHPQLFLAIKDLVPPNVRVKLVGEYCYSGGLHEVAFRLSNACAASVTDFRTPGLSAKDEASAYAKGFYGAGLGDSLMGSHWKGASLDQFNEMRGQTSSMAYIDKVMGTGAYDPENKAGWTSIIRLRSPSGDSPTAGKESFQAGGGTTGGCLDLVPQFQETERIAREVARIAWRPQGGASPGSLPAALRTSYERAVEDWDRSKGRYAATINRLQGELDVKSAAFDRLPLWKQLAQGPEMIRWFLKFQDRAGSELSDFARTRQILEDGRKVQKFLSKASDEQKTTYYRLLQCESEKI